MTVEKDSNAGYFAIAVADLREAQENFSALVDGHDGSVGGVAVGNRVGKCLRDRRQDQ